MKRTIIALALILSANAGHTAEACKTATAAEACKARTDCAWVNGFTRKNGIAVSAYCRAQPRAKDKPQAMPATVTGPAGEQYVIPGCERAPKGPGPTQGELW